MNEEPDGIASICKEIAEAKEELEDCCRDLRRLYERGEPHPRCCTHAHIPHAYIIPIISCLKRIDGK